MVVDVDLGKVGITTHGEWSSSIQYEQLSIVTYKGQSYISRKANISTPVSNTECWQLMSMKGDKGDSGVSSGGVNTGVVIQGDSIGVAFYTDGELYWTKNGNWLLDPNGDKVKARYTVVNGGAGNKGNNSGNKEAQEVNIKFKSIIFLRSQNKPSNPTGGTYTNPVADGWFDAVPRGAQQLWVSSRWFYSNETYNSNTLWSEPAIASDSVDIDYEFSSVENPGNPTTNPNNWHNIGVEGDVWMAVRMQKNGQWEDWSIMKVKGERGDVGPAGPQGERGRDGVGSNASFKSFVFVRNNSNPSKPIGGSYANPVPSGWFDAVPVGEGQVWMSSRVLSSDGEQPQQDSWSDPVAITDNAYMDYEFSTEANPSVPIKETPSSVNTNSQWSNTANNSTIWMAMRAVKNGDYVGDWQIVKIKGERGEDGTSISLKGAKDNISKLPSDNNNIGDCYSVNGVLYVWDGDSWENAGQIKGEQGASGADGRQAYIHIKYSNDGGQTFTTSNGEVPGDFIGIYSDYNSTDSTDVKTYKWKAWRGEDGFGYEYIYKLTNNNSRPLLPSVSEDRDNYVPSGWSDNPTSVSETNPYLWVANRKKVEGVWSAWRNVSLFSHYGRDGQDGASGANGRGIREIQEYYYACDLDGSSEANIPSPRSGNYSRSVPQITKEKPYLWNYEKILFTDGQEMTTQPRIIGRFGSDGKPGVNGKDAVAPKINPTTKKWQFWNGSSFVDSEFSSVGDDGHTPYIGSNNMWWQWNADSRAYVSTDIPAKARGIDRIEEYYLATHLTEVTTQTSGWTTTPQRVNEHKPYLWNYSKIIWNDGYTPHITEPCIIGNYGAIGDSDVEFLKKTFGADNLDNKEGALLRNFVAVKDTSDNVRAMVNATDIAKDQAHGKLVFASGIQGTLTNANNASFRVYEDGYVFAKAGVFDGEVRTIFKKIEDSDAVHSSGDYWLNNDLYITSFGARDGGQTIELPRPNEKYNGKRAMIVHTPLYDNTYLSISSNSNILLASPQKDDNFTFYNPASKIELNTGYVEFICLPYKNDYAWMVLNQRAKEAKVIEGYVAYPSSKIRAFMIVYNQDKYQKHLYTMRLMLTTTDITLHKSLLRDITISENLKGRDSIVSNVELFDDTLVDDGSFEFEEETYYKSHVDIMVLFAIMGRQAPVIAPISLTLTLKPSQARNAFVFNPNDRSGLLSYDTTPHMELNMEFSIYLTSGVDIIPDSTIGH